MNVAKGQIDKAGKKKSSGAKVCKDFRKAVLKKANLKSLPELDYVFRAHWRSEKKYMRLGDLAYLVDVNDIRGNSAAIVDLRGFLRKEPLKHNKAHPRNARIRSGNLLSLGAEIVSDGLKNCIQVAVIDGERGFFVTSGRTRCTLFHALFGVDLEVPVDIVHCDSVMAARILALENNISSRKPGSSELAPTRIEYEILVNKKSYAELDREPRNITRIMNPGVLGKEPLPLDFEVLDGQADGKGFYVKGVSAVFNQITKVKNDKLGKQEDVQERVLEYGCWLLNEMKSQCLHIMREAILALPDSPYPTRREWQKETLENFRSKFSQAKPKEEGEKKEVMTKNETEELVRRVGDGEDSDVVWDDIMNRVIKVDMNDAEWEEWEKRAMGELYDTVFADGSLNAIGRLAQVLLFKLDDKYETKKFKLSSVVVSKKTVERIARGLATAVMDAFANGGLNGSAKCTEVLLRTIPRLVDIPSKWLSVATMVMNPKLAYDAQFGLFSQPDEKLVLEVDQNRNSKKDITRVSSIWWIEKEVGQ